MMSARARALTAVAPLALAFALLPVAPAHRGAATAASDEPIATAINAAQRTGAITSDAAKEYTTAAGAAAGAVRLLTGVRRRELAAEIAIVRSLAARRALTAGRMPLVFLTLKRNVEWWSQHGPPEAGSPTEPGARGRHCRGAQARASRLSFPASGVVFQYYPGLGLQLQVNGTFGDVNALLHRGTPESLAAAGRILDEMRPLASPRAGALTWEYEFPFGGAAPPWTSALAQATAIEAYTAAATRLGRPDYLELARQLTGTFQRSPPGGVRRRLARDGSWYLLYSFAPREIVLNAHLNAVIALHDLGQATHDPQVLYLEHEGLRAARRHIARFDTGQWSRYAEGGAEATLNYHVLNRDFARGLCRRTGEPAICGAWHSFTTELDRRCPPAPAVPLTPPGGTGQAPPATPPDGSGQAGPTTPPQL